MLIFLPCSGEASPLVPLLILNPDVQLISPAGFAPPYRWCDRRDCAVHGLCSPGTWAWFTPLVRHYSASRTPSAAFPRQGCHWARLMVTWTVALHFLVSDLGGISRPVIAGKDVAQFTNRYWHTIKNIDCQRIEPLWLASHETENRNHRCRTMWQ